MILGSQKSQIFQFPDIQQSSQRSPAVRLRFLGIILVNLMRVLHKTCRHHHNGRWEARIGRVDGNKYLYLGTFGMLPSFVLETKGVSAFLFKKKEVPVDSTVEST